MKFRNILGYSALLALWMGAQALADWTLPTPGGNVTWEAYLTSGGTKQLPKQVITDSTGTRLGTIGNPVFTSLSGGGNSIAISSAGSLSFNATQLNGAALSNSNPVPISQIIGGAALASNNPIPGQLSQANTVLANANPLPFSPTANGAVVSGSNPIYTTPLSEPITFSASGVVPSVSSATDVMCIKGSATKLVKVKRVAISFFNGTNVYTNLLRRSTTNTGGTSSTLTATKNDVSDTAPDALVTVYSGLPTTGTLVGKYRAAVVPVGANIQEWDFHSMKEKPVYLRGTSEFLCLNLNGDLSVAPTALVSAEWSEE